MIWLNYPIIVSMEKFQLIWNGDRIECKLEFRIVLFYECFYFVFVFMYKHMKQILI